LSQIIKKSVLTKKKALIELNQIEAEAEFLKNSVCQGTLEDIAVIFFNYVTMLKVSKLDETYFCLFTQLPITYYTYHHHHHRLLEFFFSNF